MREGGESREGGRSGVRLIRGIREGFNNTSIWVYQ